MSSRKEYDFTLLDINRNPSISETYFQFRQVGLQIFDQKCRMLRRCYKSSVVRILGQFYVAGRRWNVVHKQTYEYRRDYSLLRYSSPHEVTGRGGSHKGAGV